MRGGNAVAHGNTKFKQTDLGPIPADWEVKRLGDVATIARGGSPRPIEDYLTTNPDGVNWVKIGDVGTDAKYIVKTEERIVREGVCKSRMVFPGDFLLSNSMSYGRPYILKISGCIHDGWLVIQDYQSLFDTEFLYYILGSETVTTQYKTLAAGSSVLNLNKDLVSNVLIPLPPLPEQRRIATAISDVDDLIGALGKLIEKKRAIKTGAMQQLLTGQTRLPGFGGKKFKQTDLGPIPADWEVKRLGEIAEFSTSTVPASSIDAKWYVGTENMLANMKGIFPNKESVPYQSVREYREGDILISNIRPYLKKIWLADRNGGCSTDVLVIRVIDVKSCNPAFLKMLLSNNSFFDFAMANAIGTKMPRGDKKVLVNYELPLPPLPEQRAIAGVLTDMDAEISALETEKRKYESLKSGMMQQLLTGKTRLV